jgi:hypothetical protein
MQPIVYRGRTCPMTLSDLISWLSTNLDTVPDFHLQDCRDCVVAQYIAHRVQEPSEPLPEVSIGNQWVQIGLISDPDMISYEMDTTDLLCVFLRTFDHFQDTPDRPVAEDEPWLSPEDTLALAHTVLARSRGGIGEPSGTLR